MRINLFLGLSVVLLVLSFVSCGDETETTFTVTFNSNGGSDVEKITGISSGSTITLPENPTKEEFVFSGWFIDNDIFENQFTSSTTIISNITVFAKWVKVVEEKYRFIGGNQWSTGERNTNMDWIYISDAIVTLSENTFSVSGEDYYVFFTNVYTENGGTFTKQQIGDEASWAYLYDSTGKIGFVLLATDLYYGTIEVNLGKTLCSSYSSLGVSVEGMQDIYSGWGQYEPK